MNPVSSLRFSGLEIKTIPKYTRDKNVQNFSHEQYTVTFRPQEAADTYILNERLGGHSKKLGTFSEKVVKAPGSFTRDQITSELSSIINADSFEVNNGPLVTARVIDTIKNGTPSKGPDDSYTFKKSFSR